MFKGQTLIAAPLLLLWPLLAGRFGAAAKFTIGLALAAGVILSPWLVLNNQPLRFAAEPVRWIGLVMVAAGAALGVSIMRGGLSAANAGMKWTVFWISAVAGIAALSVFALHNWRMDASAAGAGLVLLGIGIVVPPWVLPRRASGVWLAAVLAGSVWISADLFGGDWTWKTVGFEYGMRKHPDMSLWGENNGNLAQILETRFGWKLHTAVLTVHPPDLLNGLHLIARRANGQLSGWAHDWGLDGTPVTVDARGFLIGVFAVALLAAGAGAAMQSRRNDPRVLASMAAVWTLMPNLLCQMAARYQIWGAAFSALLIGISPEMGILHVLFSLLAVGMIGAEVLEADPQRSPALHAMMTRFAPDDGWITLGIGVIFLYVALVPGRRPARNELLEF
jgi:hypothetical protein